MSFASGNGVVDDNSLELMCLCTPANSMFGAAVIPLSSKYDFERLSDGSLVVLDREYICKIDEFTNMHLLCGRNGAGKSMIMNYIRNAKADGYCVVLKCLDGFVSSRQIDMTYNGRMYSCRNPVVRGVDWKTLSVSAVDLEDAGVSFKRGILGFYVDNPKLFDDVDPDLITHYSIVLANEFEWGGVIADYVVNRFQGFGVQHFSLLSIWEKDIISAVFCATIGDNTFDEWFEENSIRVHEIFNSDVELDEKLRRVQQLIFKKREIESLHDYALRLCRQIYGNGGGRVPIWHKLDSYSKVIESFRSCLGGICRVFSKAYGRAGLHFSRSLAGDMFLFRPARLYPDGGVRFLEGLSDGEYVAIKVRYDIFRRGLQGGCAILLEDEPDRSLHPEWARCFVETYVESLAQVRRYVSQVLGESYFEKKILNVVIASHSPLVLSDFFNEEVTFLEKDDDIVRVVRHDYGCFAGNIGELLLNNFFVSGTIGSYAERMIREIVSGINDKSIFKSDDDVKKARIVIENIGDKVLRAILGDQLRRGEREENRAR